MIGFVFDGSCAFVNGLALILKDGRMGYNDTLGEEIFFRERQE